MLSFKSKIGNVFCPIHFWGFSNGVPSHPWKWLRNIWTTGTLASELDKNTCKRLFKISDWFWLLLLTALPMLEPELAGKVLTLAAPESSIKQKWYIMVIASNWKSRFFFASLPKIVKKNCQIVTGILPNLTEILIANFEPLLWVWVKYLLKVR